MYRWLLLMMMCCAAPVWAVESRNHEPSLRELTAELDGMRHLMDARFDALNQKMDERDKLYTERAMRQGIAVDAALASNKELANNAAVNSKEAITKQEAAQKLYNDGHNDLIRKGEEQAKHFISRTEVESIAKNIEEKLSRIESDTRINREAIGTSAGKGAGMDQFWQYLVTIVGLLGSFGLGIYITRKKEST